MIKMTAKWVLAVCAAAILGAAVAPQTAHARQQQPTIVGTALAVNAQTGEFSTLIAALQQAGLVSALNGKGQFTVFAPTDAAFAKLGLNAGNINTVPTETLTRILLGHVRPGRVPATGVVSARQIRTLNGEFLRVSNTSAGAFLSSPGTAASQIIATDVATSNGIIHIIDTVLLF
jgi:uncharacterized surface protein with fasciclin (FAS1) repeats